MHDWHLPGALDGSSITRPVRLEAQDPGPSSRRRGFKSRTGHSFVSKNTAEVPQKDTHAIPGRGPHESPANGQVVQLADTRRSERRALAGLGVRLSPWPPLPSETGITQASTDAQHIAGGPVPSGVS